MFNVDFIPDLLRHPVEERCHCHSAKNYMFYVSHREKMEDQLEKEARFRQLMAHSSHDSAIDTDSMEWETEVVEFEKHRVRTTLVFMDVYSVNE